jgi:hypothetical protein
MQVRIRSGGLYRNLYIFGQQPPQKPLKLSFQSGTTTSGAWEIENTRYTSSR